MTGPTTASSGSPKKPAPADAGVSPGSMGLVSCLCGHLIMSKPPGWSGSSALLDKLSNKLRRSSWPLIEVEYPIGISRVEINSRSICVKKLIKQYRFPLW